MEITSLTNAKVKQWAKLKEKKYREKDQRFLVEGEHLIEEAARAGLVEAVLVEIGKAHTFVEYPVYEVTKDILRKLESSVSGTWIMAVCRMPQYHDAEFGKRVIVLDDVQDPGMSEPLFELPYPLDMMQSCYLHTAVMYTMKR